MNTMLSRERPRSASPAGTRLLNTCSLAFTTLAPSAVSGLLLLIPAAPLRRSGGTIEVDWRLKSRKLIAKGYSLILLTQCHGLIGDALLLLTPLHACIAQQLQLLVDSLAAAKLQIWPAVITVALTVKTSDVEESHKEKDAEIEQVCLRRKGQHGSKCSSPPDSIISKQKQQQSKKLCINQERETKKRWSQFASELQRVIMSKGVRATIERYKKAHACGSSSGAPLLEINAQVSSSYNVKKNRDSSDQFLLQQYYQQESVKLRNQIQMLHNTNTHLLGESVGNLSLKELKQLESRLEKSISKIRARKSELLASEINYMVKRETELQNDNMDLRTKIAEGEQQLQQVTVARSAAAISMEQMNPFAALDTKCFFPAAPFAALDMKCFLPGTLQLLEAQHQMLATELNLGYHQLAPPGTDVTNNQY
ncbi:hypothetical protein PR202_gb00268 [Eleusine coracana subsp. coracana]|uniref:K-box domain-containing protein n=1 Tax=Eleusine coracana subsp. coracana TaxID=191504 RepID=A0AAV5DSZ2_ELECO|nr:hypothetical protein PR202_gb00268 [Eleusine coracana subsp. coracana]